MDSVKSFSEFINESLELPFTTSSGDKFNFKLNVSISNGYIWVNALPKTTKDLDKIKEKGYTSQSIGNYVENAISKKIKLDCRYDSTHPGAGYWVKIDQFELAKLFK